MRNKRLHRITTAVVGLAFIIFASGCSTFGGKRTADEWLSLAYSGLAATDQYNFTGSMSMEVASGVLLEPHTFQGKVVNHQNMTIQSEQQGGVSYDWEPLQVMKRLNESNASVQFVPEREGQPEDTATVTLLVEEMPEATKARWEQHLKGEMEQLALKGTDAAGATAEQQRLLEKELERSRHELEAMLSSLKAQAQYMLVIDKRSMLPLKMEETTKFHYVMRGKPAVESRHTSVRLDAFDGTYQQTVQ
ncbi:hypothetical protein M6D81_09635 [Paenibacillus sp. J5C_2022]|uniref:hypothetical protein n=1 Tax=Paenibacillus sp. J5C2022 TaxID=2977129 RepID=UPI0021D37AD3|nr:hypothetical protein [Paenibacillus sp. J5C2022]MCU6708981.1 hypothetical protein [Paenibacillus sp. J5C2022]